MTAREYSGRRERRTAFLLYSVLLVLPTAVLGGLQWRQLVLEHDEEFAAVPRNADDAARRLTEALRDRLHLLLEAEQRRHFYFYAEVYSEAFLVSPLLSDARPPGVLAWFAYEPAFGAYHRPKDVSAELDVFFGSRGPRPALREQLKEAAGQYLERWLSEGGLIAAMRIEQLDEPRDYPLDVVAVNRGHKVYLDCLASCLPALRGRTLPVTLSHFDLEFYRDESGEPWVVATRRVVLPEDVERLLPDLPKKADCIRKPLAWSPAIVQGFFIDPDWLFDELPADLAARVLGGSQRLVPADEVSEPRGGEEYRASIRLVKELGLARNEEDVSFGALAVAIDRAELRERFQRQELRFLGVAAMLALSLATGMVLLLRSVTRDLEQARRAENFVAAVTHELRTPLSAIKLHGEMLLEGWVDTDEKRADYYRRIVRETGRLSVLVERVLEKSRLTSGPPKPRPGDLSELVGALSEDLCRADGSDGRDLAFELTPDLPPVLLSREAVASILANLVENARKYAPVDLSAPGAEPIRIRTALRDGRVVLEVADRGPGVPASERTRIFDAFYRAGNERTRTTTGTGLGLHIVALHAAAIGARATVLDHPGGGALFQVHFRMS